MSLTAQQSLKFDIYSLFCHHLVARVTELRGTLLDANGDIDERQFRICLARFDEALKDLFQTVDIVRTQAFELMARRLENIGEDLKPKYPGVLTCLLDLIETVQVEPDWTYADGIEKCHREGRRLAQLFYENSTSALTKQRTSLQATLNYEYGDPNIQELARIISRSIDNQELEERIKLLIPKLEARVKKDFKGQRGFLYTFERPPDNNFLIVVPFLDSDNFMQYASYPYLFMHEYSAHIFSTDYNNDLFNDGWLIYAASDFLISRWRNHWELDFLIIEQVVAFKRFLYDLLEPGPQARHNQAEDFDLFVRPWDASWFQRIIYELAAYVPAKGQSKTWPTDVLRRLARDQQTARDRTHLKNRMKQAPDLDSLYPALKDLN